MRKAVAERVQETGREARCPPPRTAQQRSLEAGDGSRGPRGVLAPPNEAVGRTPRSQIGTASQVGRGTQVQGGRRRGMTVHGPAADVPWPQRGGYPGDPPAEQRSDGRSVSGPRLIHTFVRLQRQCFLYRNERSGEGTVSKMHLFQQKKNSACK